VAVRSLREAFDKAIDKAGLQDFHFHDLRHTFATRLVQNGVDPYKVKELLGHKTITMTMRYAHHYPESLRTSVEVPDKNYYNLRQQRSLMFDDKGKNPLKSSMREWRNWQTRWT
jgi:integrase